MSRHRITAAFRYAVRMAGAEQRGQASEGRHGYAVHAVYAAVAALLTLHWVMAVTSVGQKSATFDEWPYVAAGLTQWVWGDHRLVPENGMVSQRFATMLVAGRVELDPDAPGWREAGAYQYGGWLATRLEPEQRRRVLWICRATNAVLSVWLGLLIFIWARHLFGAAGGFIALIVHVLSPNLLAHSRLVTTEVAVTLLLTASVGAVWLLLQRVTIARLIGAGVLCGLAVSTKLSGLLVIPIAAVMWAVRLRVAAPLPVFGRDVSGDGSPGRLRQGAVLAGAAVLVALLTMATVWGCYGFRYSATTGPGQLEYTWPTVLEAAGSAGDVIEVARDAKVLPEAWLFGVAHIVAHGEGGRPAFWNGEFSERGWVGFFPYCVAVKTPVGVFVLLALAAAGIVVVSRDRERSLGSCAAAAAPSGSRFVVGGDVGEAAPSCLTSLAFQLTPIVSLLAVYWLLAVLSPMNIGLRYVLPTYPAMFILTGGAALAAGRWPRSRYVIGVALAAIVAASLWIRPHYLAFFNVTVGGPSRGYRHLVDSSLDWGQDYAGLVAYLEAQNVPKDRVYISYFGTAPSSKTLPSYFDTESRPRGGPWRGGVYAISATLLQQVYGPRKGPYTQAEEAEYQQLVALWREGALNADGLDRFDQLRFARLCDRLRHREPDAMIGYSILVYHLSEGDAHAYQFD